MQLGIGVGIPAQAFVGKSVSSEQQYGPELILDPDLDTGPPTWNAPFPPWTFEDGLVSNDGSGTESLNQTFDGGPVENGASYNLRVSMRNNTDSVLFNFFTGDPDSGGTYQLIVNEGEANPDIDVVVVANAAHEGFRCRPLMAHSFNLLSISLRKLL